MAKKIRKSKQKIEKKGTNWILIGVIAVIGVIGLFSLLMFSVFGDASSDSSGSNNNLVLNDYCDENPDRCVNFGSPEAAVKFVEVSDFGCPHCRTFHQEKASTIKDQYVDANLVEWIVLPYALRDDTLPATNAALCAEEEGKYFEFAEALFGQPTIEDSVSREGFFAAAEEVGLDLEPFSECLEENRYNNVIRANQQVARQADVRGTPTFFINGEIVRGNVPLSEFERLFVSYLQSS